MKPTASVDKWKQVGACVLNNGSAIDALNKVSNAASTTILCRTACLTNLACKAY